MSDNSGKMGFWEEDREELSQKLVDGAGLYSTLDEGLEFKTAALRLIVDELQTTTENMIDAACFVLANKELFAQVKPSCKRVPMLRSTNARSRPLHGSLWFVPRALTHGFAIDTQDKTPDDVFNMIEKFGAGNHYTVVVHPGPESKVDIYPEGISSPETSEAVDLSVTKVGVEDIEMALDGLYQLIRSPDQMKALPLWKDATKWHPIEKAEDAIQNEVTRVLAGRFAPYLEVRSEQPSTIGRTDVELIQTWRLPPGHEIRHALIELKVLRSYGSTGRPVSDKVIRRHISQGVRQAAQYGNANNSKIRMLCCYDMRQEDVSNTMFFSEFYMPCETRKVRLKRYFLYNSSEALRQALDNVAIAAGASPLPG